MQKTAFGISLLGTLTAAVISCASCIAPSPPNRERIRTTIETALDVKLPDNFAIEKTESFRAPFFPIQGIVYGEEIEIVLPEPDFNQLLEELRNRNVLSSGPGETLRCDRAYDRGTVAFTLFPDRTSVGYIYGER